MSHEVSVHVDGTDDQTQAAEIVRQALEKYGCQARIETVYRVAVSHLPRFPRDVLTAAAVIADAFHHSLKVMPTHVQHTFYRQRRGGSQWGRHIPTSVHAWAEAIAWREVPHDQLPPGTAKPECRYFKTNDCGLLDGAVEHVGLSTDVPRGKIFSVNGAHGWGLMTTQELPKQCATEAWLILGPAFPDDKTLVPYTAFPGRMAAAPPADWDGDLAKLDLETVPYGVKYVSPETADLCA